MFSLAKKLAINLKSSYLFEFPALSKYIGFHFLQQVDAEKFALILFSVCAGKPPLRIPKSLNVLKTNL